jgi:ABC-type Co2+ transport system permease subunit
MKLFDAGFVLMAIVFGLTVVAYELHKLEKTHSDMVPILEIAEGCAEAEVDTLLHVPGGTTAHVISALDDLPDFR